MSRSDYTFWARMLHRCVCAFCCTTQGDKWHEVVSSAAIGETSCLCQSAMYNICWKPYFYKSLETFIFSEENIVGKLYNNRKTLFELKIWFLEDMHMISRNSIWISYWFRQNTLHIIQRSKIRPVCFWLVIFHVVLKSFRNLFSFFFP